jgi:hypothetical protein
MGAGDISDLQTEKYTIALATHLRLPPIKHDKLVGAVLQAGSSWVDVAPNGASSAF